MTSLFFFSKTPEEHTQRLWGVFEKLYAAGLQVKLSKCEFLKLQIAYLGHIVSKDGIETDPKKKIIMEGPVPKTVTEVQSFLVYTNYYCKFIPKYAQIAWPINQLVWGKNANKKKSLVEWTAECQQVFEQLKWFCSQTPIIA